MKDLNNIHPGEALAEFLEDYGLSQNRLTTELRVPVRRINAIIKEERGISADTAVRLARYFRNSPQFWLNLQEMYDITKAENELVLELEKIHPVAMAV